MFRVIHFRYLPLQAQASAAQEELTLAREEAAENSRVASREEIIALEAQVRCFILNVFRGIRNFFRNSSLHAASGALCSCGYTCA